MIEYTSKPITIQNQLSQLYKPDQYNTEIREDKITIQKKDESFIAEINISESDIQTELSLINFYADYYISGEGFLTFILLDDKNSIGTSEIKIDGAYKGSIKRNTTSFGVLIGNLAKIINTDLLENHTETDFEELIREEVVVCELRWEESSVIDDEKMIDKIINSVLTNLSYSVNISFTNPRNLIKIQDQQSANALEFTLKIVKDEEPMHYFLTAEKIEYPHLKYLEYYHVLEYYFLHKKIEDFENIIKEIISIDLLNKGKPTNYYEKVTELMDFYFGKDDNELSQLKYVINSDLGYQLIREIINGSSLTPGFLSKKVLDIDETVIDLNKVNRDNQLIQTADKNIYDAFCDGLSRRIYKIRNFIVHTKKFEKQNVFIPTNGNFEFLKNDIELIRMLAYSLMTKK